MYNNTSEACGGYSIINTFTWPDTNENVLKIKQYFDEYSKQNLVLDSSCIRGQASHNLNQSMNLCHTNA